MAIDLTLSSGEGKVHFKKGLPENYNGPLLRGALALHAKTNTAEMVIQELEAEGYTIRFSIVKFLRKISASGHLNLNGMYSYFMLKNGIRKEFESVGKLYIRQDQYSCIYTEPTKCKAKFEKNAEYRTLGIFYTPQLIRELIPYFPELKKILNDYPSAILPGRKCWMLPSMSEITTQLLNCPYDENSCMFYFDVKVREMLYYMMENAYKRKPQAVYFSPWEISKIHEARGILENCISGSPPTLSAISRQVALNSLKLKTGFKQCFNMSMFEWLTEQKMQRAKALVLNTNLPIKAIGEQVGYNRSTNFITAFKRRFGTTPRSMRS